MGQPAACDMRGRPSNDKADHLAHIRLHGDLLGSSRMTEGSADVFPGRGRRFLQLPHQQRHAPCSCPRISNFFITKATILSRTSPATSILITATKTTAASMPFPVVISWGIRLCQVTRIDSSATRMRSPCAWPRATSCCTGSAHRMDPDGTPRRDCAGLCTCTFSASLLTRNPITTRQCPGPRPWADGRRRGGDCSNPVSLIAGNSDGMMGLRMAGSGGLTKASVIRCDPTITR